MILLQSAGLAVFGTPHMGPARTDPFQGTADFVLLFERAMGTSMTSQMIDAVISDSPIGTVVNPEGGEGVVATQTISGGHDEKIPATPVIDPAGALLAAMFGIPVSPNVQVPAPSRSPALQDVRQGIEAPAVTPEPPCSPHRPPVTSLSTETGIPAVRADGGSVATQVEVSRPLTSIRTYDGQEGSSRMPPHLLVPSQHEEVRAFDSPSLLEGEQARMRGTNLTDDPRAARQPTGRIRTDQEIVKDDRTEVQVDPSAVANVAPLGLDAASCDRSSVLRIGSTWLPAADLRVAAPSAESTVTVSVKATLPPSPDATDVTTTSPGFMSVQADVVTHPTVDSSQDGRGLMADIAIITSPTDDRSMNRQVRGDSPDDAHVMAGDQLGRDNLKNLEDVKSDGMASIAVIPHNDGSQGDLQSDGSYSVRRASPQTAAVREVQDGVGRSVVDRTTDQAIDPLRSAAVMEDRVDGEGAVSGRIPERRSPWRRPTEGIETFSDQPRVRRPDQLEGEDIRRYIRVEWADSHRAVVRQGTPSVVDTPDGRQERSVSDETDGCRPVDRGAPSFDDGRQARVDLPGIAAPQEGQVQSGPAAPPVRPRALVDQVAEQIVTMARIGRRSEGSHVQLRLHPQTLGEVVVEVFWKDIGIVAAIKTENHVAGELLAHDLGRLRNALGEQGIPVAGLDVQVGVDLRQWNHAGNGLHAAPGPEHPPPATSWHDPRPMLSVIPAMDQDRLIDVRV